MSTTNTTNTTIATFPCSGAATPEHSLAFGLTHAVDADGEALCKRVRAESILDDELWDGEGCTERAPTCQTCLKRDPRHGGKPVRARSRT